MNYKINSLIDGMNLIIIFVSIHSGSRRLGSFNAVIQNSKNIAIVNSKTDWRLDPLRIVYK